MWTLEENTPRTVLHIAAGPVDHVFVEGQVRRLLCSPRSDKELNRSK
jgi:hypothetical protein